MTEPDNYEMTVSEIVKYFRKGRGLTQEGFGKALGRTRTAVTNWETGRHAPDPYDVVKWAMNYSDWRAEFARDLLIWFQREG